MVHTGPSGSADSGFASAASGGFVSAEAATATFLGVVGASCFVGATILSSSVEVGGSRGFSGLMECQPMLSRKTPRGTGPRVDPMFASSSASVLLARDT